MSHLVASSSCGPNRRTFLAGASTVFALPILPSYGARHRAAPYRFHADPFTLGIASGDPSSDGMVLWTRLAPSPLDEDGGMPPEPVEVTWEIASDEDLKNIVARGTTMAVPQLAHSVHVEVTGLPADRWFWYHFRAGDATSPIGRTRTLPTAGSMPERLRFAFASCQHYEAGLFTAYRHMAEQELDLVFHLGDYIYEGKGRDNQVRKHAGGKLLALADYRIRHAQYRSDPLLHGMHSKCPWFVTWDDHEFENNYANSISERKDSDSTEFLKQRANAYQAYYEAMPLRRSSIPTGPDMQLYRKASYGRLAELFVLDTRQYRTDQPNGDGRRPMNAAALDPHNTMLGKPQHNWLKNGLVDSRAHWNVLAQQVMMGLVGFTAQNADEMLFSMDQWPGYAHERAQLLRFVAERNIANPIVITGDIHSNWVNDLRVDDRDDKGPIVATEFVGTSITSGGNGSATVPGFEKLQQQNPGLRFHNRQRGYVACTVTASEWTTDYLVADQVTAEGGKIEQRARFVVEAGRAGVQQA